MPQEKSRNTSNYCKDFKHTYTWVPASCLEKEASTWNKTSNFWLSRKIKGFGLDK